MIARVLSDHDFVDAFERCDIGGHEFQHDDHVRLAWIYLRAHPLLDAIARFRTSLQRFAAHHAVSASYHETITWAYLLLIHERMQRDGAPADWESFRRANSDLFSRAPSLLERYYAPGTLDSDAARKTFILPDAGLDRAAR
jgi:hypothetical protein